jgi:hypothetical protein
MDAAKYAATERLRNGAVLHVRALQPDDRTEMLAAVGRFSKQTLYRRFFAPKRSFSEREIEFFLNVDFTNHVALVAVLAESGQQMIVGGARYIVSHPGCAEVAFAFDDPHQKLGCHTPDQSPDQDCASGRLECSSRGAARNVPMLMQERWPCHDDPQ